MSDAHPGRPATPPPGPPPPTYTPPGAPTPSGPSRLPWIVALVAVAAIALVAIAIVLVRGDDKAAAAEVFLEPAANTGTDPFATGLKGPATPVSTTTQAPGTTVGTTAPSGTTATRSVSGGTPGLYGGTRNEAVCDPAQQADFLAKNPAVAGAFVAALNADPTLRWSGGTKLTTAQIPTYLNELTPMVLTSDTRVTNHGYRNGKPTPRQAVLQAGTAVMVDAYGVPRVKCNCGNPLAAPTPLRRAPRYTGATWPGFSPQTVVVVQVTQVQIDVYVVTDVVTGEPFSRPAGTTGGEDGDVPTPDEDGPPTTSTTSPATTAPSSTSPSTTSAPPTGPGDQNAFCARWKEVSDQYRDIDPSVPEVLTILDELVALAPPDIRPQMTTLRDAARRAAATGATELDVSNDPEAGAAVAVLIGYLQNTCGFAAFG